MPRFALDDADMTALIGYLKKLGARRVPGVTDTLLHFATIVTPEADPVKRRGMLDVLQQYVTDKNTFPFGAEPARCARRAITMYSKSMYIAQPPLATARLGADRAARDLERAARPDFAREPVMAVISGVGGRHWAPVHDFCENRHVPCLFPNVEVPEVADGDFYSLYFSKGVLLEAELIARRISDLAQGPAGPDRAADLSRRRQRRAGGREPWRRR